MVTKLCFYVLCALCVCFASGVGRAQDSGLPVVLKPDDFLTNNVQLIGTLPILNTDDAARKLYYFDSGAGTWAAYPYPGAFDAVYSLPRSDGTYVLSPKGFYAFEKYTAQEVWILDPRKGEFSHPQIACDSYAALKGVGKWIVYQDVETQLYHLCSTETGELSPPLPDDIQPNMCADYFRRPTSTSPDNKFVLFADCKFEYDPVSLYSYEIATGQFRSLGLGSNTDNETVEVERWADNTHPIIRIYAFRNPSEHRLYVTNVAQEGSLELIADLSSFLTAEWWPTYYDDPPRYEWVPAEQGNFGQDVEEGETPECGLHVFSLETFQLQLYPFISKVCGEGIAINDGSGDRLYRSIKWPVMSPPKTASLIRFNPATGGKQVVYTGEVEWLSSVSSEGHYALIILDESSQIDVLRYSAFEQNIWWDFMKSPHYAIVDLKTGAQVQTGNSLNAVNYGDRWLNDFTITAFDKLVEIHENHAVEVPVGTIQSLSPDKRWLLMQDDFDTNEFSLLNIETGERLAITQPSDPKHYSMDIQWQADNTLSVRINDTVRGYDWVLSRWRIQVHQ